MRFHGAKVAILAGADVVALKRDDRPDLPWPGYWDLPGGGREGRETPEETAIRETREETGLHLAPKRFVHRRCYGGGARRVLFFGALWPGLVTGDLRLGDEGQALVLMPVTEFLSRADAIPMLRTRLAAWLGQ